MSHPPPLPCCVHHFQELTSMSSIVCLVLSFHPDPAGLRRLSLPQPSCPMLPAQPTLHPTLPPRPSSALQPALSPRPSSTGSSLSEESYTLCLKPVHSSCRPRNSLSLGGKATIFHTGRKSEQTRNLHAPSGRAAPA